MTGSESLVSGTLTGLNVFNVISGSAGFALSVSTVSPTTDLTNATLITIALDNLAASAGTSGFGVAITGGNLGVAVLVPAAQNTGAYIAVTGDSLAGSLALGTSVSASVTGLLVSINTVANLTGMNPLDWETTFVPPVDPGANLNLTPPVKLPVTFTDGVLSLSGNLTSLNLFNVITGSAGFDLSESPIDSAAGAAVSLSGATLITVGLSNLAVNAASNGFGISISGGDLGIAVVEAPTPTESGTTDNRYWIAADGSGFTASLLVGSFASATLTGLSVDINTSGGQMVSGGTTTPATALDWATEFSPEIDPGQNLTPAPSTSIAITLTAQEFAVAGSLASLNIANTINESWATGSQPGFALSESTVEVAFGGAAPADLTGASQFQIQLTNISAGMNSGNYGASVAGASILLAVIVPAKPSTGTDSRYWFAVSASGLAGSLNLGGASGVQASVSNVALAINTSGGTSPSGTAAAPIDWTKDIAYGTGDFGGTPPSGVMSVPLTAGGFSITGSLTGLTVSNILSGTANFALTESSINLTQGGSVLDNATLITLALGNLSLTAESNGFGVAITSGDIGIAFIEPPAPAAGQTDTRYWVGVSAANLAATLDLSTNITASVSNMTVQFNQAGGTGPDGTKATALNWLSSISGTTTPINPGAILGASFSGMNGSASFIGASTDVSFAGMGTFSGTSTEMLTFTPAGTGPTAAPATITRRRGELDRGRLSGR